MHVEWDEEKLLTVEIDDESYPSRELIEKYLPEDRSSFPPLPDDFYGTSDNPYLARLFVIMWINPHYRYMITSSRDNLHIECIWDDLQYTQQDKLDAIGVYLRFTDWELGDVFDAQWEAGLTSDHVNRQADDVALMNLIALHASDTMLYYDMTHLSYYMMGASDAGVPFHANKLLEFTHAHESGILRRIPDGNKIIAGFIHSGIEAKQIVEFGNSDGIVILDDRKFDAFGFIAGASYDIPALQEKLKSVPANVLKEIYTISQ